MDVSHGRELTCPVQMLQFKGDDTAEARLPVSSDHISVNLRARAVTAVICGLAQTRVVPEVIRQILSNLSDHLRNLRGDTPDAQVGQAWKGGSPGRAQRYL